MVRVPLTLRTSKSNGIFNVLANSVSVLFLLLLFFFGFLFSALSFSKIRATGNRESGRMPSSVSFSFQFPPNLPNWVKVLCHNQPGSRVRISNERARMRTGGSIKQNFSQQPSSPMKKWFHLAWGLFAEICHLLLRAPCSLLRWAHIYRVANRLSHN